MGLTEEAIFSTPGGALRDASLWRCANVELDESTLELRVGGELVPLEPKPLELLMWLLRHPGEVVTRDELLDALWTGRVVSESVLTTCVAKLRQALGDDDHSLVKTVHGFGYRLTGAVERELRGRGARPPPARLVAGESPPHRPNWRLVRRFDESLAENWLAEHARSGERRVLKFAFDVAQVSRLKREITVHRVLRGTLGPRDDLVRVIDWNIEQPPYFLELEYCAGGNLIEWLASAGGAAVPLQRRIELAAEIADALAAAHSAGVLHKDVKPGNVMVQTGVDGDVQIKLADFGSGLVIDDARLEALHITRMGLTQTIDAASGTFSYLAPEVLAGQPPTVRSDVYALGVLSYQLIVADLRRSLAPGWERDIDDELLRADIGDCCDQDPARRLGDAAELARRLRTLEPRRAALAADRASEVQAESLRLALARSRVRRRWLSVVATVTTLGFIVSAVMVVQVRKARAAATLQAAAARSVNAYLVQDLLGAADPLSARSVPPAASGVPSPLGQVPVGALLDRAAAGAGQRFAGQPGLEAAVRLSLGQAYGGLAAFGPAAEQFVLSARMARIAEPADPLAVATAMFRAAGAARDLDQFDRADAYLEESRQALAGAAADSPREVERLRAEIEQQRAWFLYKRGDYDKSIAGMAAGLPALRKAFGDDSEEVAIAYERLSNVQLAGGQVRPAVASARQAVELRLKLDPPDHPKLIDPHAALGDALRWAGENDEADRETRLAYALAVKYLGPDHFRTLVVQGSMASMAQQLKRYDEAVRLFEDAVERSTKRYGTLIFENSVLLNNLALAYADAGRMDDSVRALRSSLDISQQLLGKENPENLSTEHNLADVLVDAGRAQEALAMELRLLPVVQRVLGPRHFLIGVIRRTQGRALLQLGRRAEAQAALREARELLVEHVGESHARVAQVDTLLREAAVTR